MLASHQGTKPRVTTVKLLEWVCLDLVETWDLDCAYYLRNPFADDLLVCQSRDWYDLGFLLVSLQIEAFEAGYHSQVAENLVDPLAVSEMSSYILGLHASPHSFFCFAGKTWDYLLRSLSSAPSHY